MIRLFNFLPFIRGYYWSTLGFMILDFYWDINLRVAALPDRGARMIYYAFCFVCLAVFHWKPSLSALTGLIESSVNICLLVAGILLPIYSLPGTILEGGTVVNPLTVEKVVNFFMAGMVAVSSFHACVNRLKPKTF